MISWAKINVSPVIVVVLNVVLMLLLNACLASVVDDAEIGFIFELAGLLELGVCALFLDQLVYKGLVRGLGEPALFI